MSIATAGSALIEAIMALPQCQEREDVLCAFDDFLSAMRKDSEEEMGVLERVLASYGIS